VIGGASEHGLVGQQVGKYQILKRLAAGGMAELFLARTTGIQGFQKVFALKRILPQLADNEDFVEMFLREAKLAATLEHPNIVHVSDFGKADDDYFFVMSYVHGRDLLSVLRAAAKKGKRIPIDCAIAISLGTCAGLHYAHEHKGFDGKPLGLVHRDVSPTNVLVSYDGNVKIVDFGIAKAAAQNVNTRAGVRKGKASYMSPEQCRGASIDRRSDIWSIGVVLWEMVTMARLFKADNELAIMHKILHEVPPELRDMDPQAPGGLQEIIDKCLAHEPSQRYQTARELQQDLERFASGADLSPSSTGLSEYMHGLFGEPDVPWAGIEMPFGPGQGGTRTVDYGATATVRSEGTPPPAIERTPVGSPSSHSNVVSMPPHASMWGTAASASIHPPPSKALWIGGGALLGANAAVLVWWLSSWMAANQPQAQVQPGPAPTAPAAQASAEP